MLKKIVVIGLVVALAAALVGGAAYILLRSEAQASLAYAAQIQRRAEAWSWPGGYRDGETECVYGQECAERRGWAIRGYSLVDVVSELLDKSLGEVIDELRDGKSIADLVQEAGIDSQALVETFLTQRQETLNQAVAAGRLSQEQADLMLSQMQEEVTARIQERSQSRFGPGCGDCPEFRHNLEWNYRLGVQGRHGSPHR